MKFSTYILKTILLSIILLCYGCEYENPVIDQRKVEGKLIEDNGFPVYNRYIALNSVPITIPNLSGEFYFENVSTPYDLNVLSLNLGHVTIFKNLTNRYPLLLCDEQMVAHNFQVVIKITDIIWWKTILARFISKSIFEHGYVNHKRMGSDLIITYGINTPITETTINGKFIILECTSTSSPYNIISIDNYAEKSYTVRLNSNDTLIFESEDFNFNPVESNVLVRIENNPNLYDTNTDIFIDFTNYCYNSKIKLNSFDTEQNSTYDFMVPASLPTDFKIRIENKSILIQDSLHLFFNKKWIYLNPSEYGEINYNSSFGLSYPANNQTNVDRSTKFIIHDDEPKGIYNFIIRGYQDFEIFTDLKEITLPHLNDLRFTLKPNTEYEWYAEKYTSFDNIDDFVSSPYYERKENGSIIESKRRFFKTSPNY